LSLPYGSVFISRNAVRAHIEPRPQDDHLVQTFAEARVEEIVDATFTVSDKRTLPEGQQYFEQAAEEIKRMAGE
jgi:hypothetical protein